MLKLSGEIIYWIIFDNFITGETKFFVEEGSNAEEKLLGKFLRKLSNFESE